MTATVSPAPGARSAHRLAILTDTAVITRRNLRRILRTPRLLVVSSVQPVLFVLLFRYVFGGAIQVPGAGGYVNFLMPGIIAQTAAFATFATAIALAQESTKGVIDRFRAMPIARSAVLAGRLVADSVRMLIVILVIVGVGYAVGFRFQNGVLGAVGMVLLAEAFGIAVCLVSAFVGLAIRDEESVQAFGLIWIFPLTFVSSAFVPVATMPSWLQGFANNQPVTLVINAMRAMALGGPVNPALWESLVWLAGVLIVFTPLAVRSYRRVG